MGCDAHPIIERLEDDGTWVGVDYKYDHEHADRPEPMEGLSQRDYNLFSILADVRNGGEVTPLFPHREWPENRSERCRNEMDDDVDLHSHTFFTVRELVEVDWDSDASTGVECLLFGDDYQAFKDLGRMPPGWSQWDRPRNYTLGRNRDIVTEAEMTLLLVSGEGLPTKCKANRHVTWSGPMVRVMSPMSYRQFVPDFVKTTLPALVALGDPDKHRVLIAYDN